MSNTTNFDNERAMRIAARDQTRDQKDKAERLRLGGLSIAALVSAGFLAITLSSQKKNEPVSPYNGSPYTMKQLKGLPQERVKVDASDDSGALALIAKVPGDSAIMNKNAGLRNEMVDEVQAQYPEGIIPTDSPNPALVPILSKANKVPPVASRPASSTFTVPTSAVTYTSETPPTPSSARGTIPEKPVGQPTNIANNNYPDQSPEAPPQ